MKMKKYLSLFIATLFITTCFSSVHGMQDDLNTQLTTTVKFRSIETTILCLKERGYTLPKDMIWEIAQAIYRMEQKKKKHHHPSRAGCVLMQP